MSRKQAIEGHKARLFCLTDTRAWNLPSGGAVNRKQAIEGHKARLAHLTDTQARNLMEHAANKTPLLPVEDFSTCFVDEEGRCGPAALCSTRAVPSRDANYGSPEYLARDDALVRLRPPGLVMRDGYYNEMAALDHATLRRLWINEGRRRGYVLEDCEA